MYPPIFSANSWPSLIDDGLPGAARWRTSWSGSSRSLAHSASSVTRVSPEWPRRSSPVVRPSPSWPVHATCRGRAERANTAQRSTHPPPRPRHSRTPQPLCQGWPRQGVARTSGPRPAESPKSAPCASRLPRLAPPPLFAVSTKTDSAGDPKVLQHDFEPAASCCLSLGLAACVWG
jgi:hypothetical protein